MSPNHRGPYKAMEVLPSGVTYMIRRIGSVNKKDEFKVHVDDIKYLRRFESATGLVARATKAAAENTKAWEVQHIMGERTVEGGQKQYVYLVKWGLITRGYFSLL